MKLLQEKKKKLFFSQVSLAFSTDICHEVGKTIRFALLMFMQVVDKGKPL